MNKIVNGVKESVFEYFVISAGMLYELIFLMLTCYILLYFQYYAQHVLSGFFRSAPSKEEVYVVLLESKDTNRKIRTTFFMISMIRIIVPTLNFRTFFNCWSVCIKSFEMSAC